MLHVSALLFSSLRLRSHTYVQSSRSTDLISPGQLIYPVAVGGRIKHKTCSIQYNLVEASWVFDIHIFFFSPFT